MSWPKVKQSCTDLEVVATVVVVVVIVVVVSTVDNAVAVVVVVVVVVVLVAVTVVTSGTEQRPQPSWHTVRIFSKIPTMLEDWHIPPCT